MAMQLVTRKNQEPTFIETLIELVRMHKEKLLNRQRPE